MRIWGIKQRQDIHRGGIARTVLAGASRDDLVREVLQRLAGAKNVDRIGVWLDAGRAATRAPGGPLSFRGQVCELEAKESPEKWTVLSAEAPLPVELLRSGNTVEQNLERLPPQPLIATLLGLRRAMWVPIENKGAWRGVLLAGTRRKHGALPRELLELVAAELMLAVKADDLCCAESASRVDLSMVRKALTFKDDEENADDVLTAIAEDCTTNTGAVFATIGILERAGWNTDREARDKGRVTFSWKSGSASWIRAMDWQPLCEMWRRALRGRCPIVREAGLGPTSGEVAPLVAIPFQIDHSDDAGVLVAGFPADTGFGDMVARSELRAALAAAALGRKKRKADETKEETWKQTLLESNREATVVLDARGGVTALSSGAKELTGTVSVVRGARFSELFRWQDQTIVEDWTRRELNGGRIANHERQAAPEAELKNGVKVFLHGATPAGKELAALRLERAETRHGTHISERSEAELGGLIEWLGEGVLLFDCQENIRAMNTRFAQIVGLRPEEAQQLRTLEQLSARVGMQTQTPEHFVARWREMAQRLDGGMREELQFISPSPRIIERLAKPVLDAAGRRVGRVEIYRELTAQCAFQTKLLQTEKLAALGQMLMGVAHELSNPVTSILGYSQRLLLRSDGTEQREAAKKICQEAERATSILRQLLSSARETRPERELVALNTLIQQSVDLQMFGLESEGIKVEMELDPILPPVRGDAGQLQQVLMNLLGNARHALTAQAHGGIIRVRTKWSGQETVVLQVSDNGPGIPEGILARIFDPFFTTKPVGVGTGLGLAIVFSVAREHGGSVNAGNAPNGGAIFSIELPVAQTAELQEQFATTPRVAATVGKDGVQRPEGRGEFRGARVLVVEDEPTVARLIADVLEDQNMQVEVLLDGRDALHRAGREHYDLVICDIRMPGIDGQNFYKTLVDTGNSLKDRFLFVTGDVLALHTHDFLERYGLPHVAKPFRVEELTEKVAQVLSREAWHSKAPAKANSAGTR